MDFTPSKYSYSAFSSVAVSNLNDSSVGASALAIADSLPLNASDTDIAEAASKIEALVRNVAARQ
jgi:hypothetical protein